MIALRRLDQGLRWGSAPGLAPTVGRGTVSGVAAVAAASMAPAALPVKEGLRANELDSRVKAPPARRETACHRTRDTGVAAPVEADAARRPLPPSWGEGVPPYGSSPAVFGVAPSTSSLLWEMRVRL